MSRQGWVEALVAQYQAGPTLTGSTTPTSILLADTKYTFPAAYFGIGRVLRITGQGTLSNVVTTPGTLTIDLRLGGTVIFTSGAMTLSTTANTSLPFQFEIVLTLYADGSSANFMGQGWIISRTVQATSGLSNAGATNCVVPMPTTSPAVGSNFDATAAQQLDCFATWSLNNANSIQLQQFTVEALN